MAVPSIYINLEDDVSAIVERLKRQATASQVVLVCPKRCFLFSNSDNLVLLKQQADSLGKQVFILTMDERGQEYAKQAGLGLRFLSNNQASASVSDIKFQRRAVLEPAKTELASRVSGISEIAKKFIPAAILNISNKPEALPHLPVDPLANPKTESVVMATETFYPSEIQEGHSREGRKKDWNRKWIAGLVGASLILVLVLLVVVLPKASVVVYPKAEPLTRDMEISISPNVSAPDITKLTLPGTKVDETLTLTNKFQSQGKKQLGNKATGTVKIYNFTKTSINLKAATTVLTLGGQNYNLTQDVNGLRPTTYKNAVTKEVDPASLGPSVQIIASSGGENFNLPAGTRLEISNQVFGSKPQLLYAKTDSEISGGTTRYLSVIAQEDFNSSKQALADQALSQIRDKLAQRGLVLADNAFTLDSSQFSLDNQVGTETPNFNATLVAKISGMAFTQVDLNNLIYQRIGETLAADKTLQKDQPGQISYKVKSFDIANQLLVLQVHFQGQALFNVDLGNISSELVGKSLKDVNEILQSKAEIDRVEITLAPAWQKNFPLFASKIKLTVAKP